AKVPFSSRLKAQTKKNYPTYLLLPLQEEVYIDLEEFLKETLQVYKLLLTKATLKVLNAGTPEEKEITLGLFNIKEKESKGGGGKKKSKGKGKRKRKRGEVITIKQKYLQGIFKDLYNSSNSAAGYSSTYNNNNNNNLDNNSFTTYKRHYYIRQSASFSGFYNSSILASFRRQQEAILQAVVQGLQGWLYSQAKTLRIIFITPKSTVLNSFNNFITNLIIQ
ncbi:hypothetical protein N5P37_011752, partial [Trichoderma harzianum]